VKNKLTDLNNHLFAALERLADESLEGEKLLAEIERSKAVTCVAREVILNGKLVLEAQKAFDDGLVKRTHEMLEVKS
jgi:hypothetical protein